jgi:hypothetical protein
MPRGSQCKLLLAKRALISPLALILFLVSLPSCDFFAVKPLSPRFYWLYDGLYDNNNAFVPEFAITRIARSIYLLKTSIRYADEGQEKTKILYGKAIALRNRKGYLLLTVNHVVSINGISYRDYFGTYFKPVQIIGENTSVFLNNEFIAVEKLIGSKKADLALFKIPQEIGLISFPYAVGDSDDLQTGDHVTLFGNPFLMGTSPKHGSVIRTSVPESILRGFYPDVLNPAHKGKEDENYFLMDIALDKGDSGGPIIAYRDTRPELVGLVQKRIPRLSNIGWGIKINHAIETLEKNTGLDLSEKHAPRCYSGSEYQRVNRDYNQVAK